MTSRDTVSVMGEEAAAAADARRIVIHRAEDFEATVKFLGRNLYCINNYCRIIHVLSKCRSDKKSRKQNYCK